jgi:hypothetical protein
MGLCQTKQYNGVEENEGPIIHAAPHAGQTPASNKKTKKAKASQYPGNKRPVNNPHVPNESEFNGNNTGGVTKHFVNYGGGNALTLVDGPLPNSQNNAAGKQYVQGTCRLAYDP